MILMDSCRFLMILGLIFPCSYRRYKVRLLRAECETTLLESFHKNVEVDEYIFLSKFLNSNEHFFLLFVTSRIRKYSSEISLEILSVICFSVELKLK